ncbi:MAG: hypothetical protein P8L46_13495 [Acidimicrobiales bacterium]|nr:hypothetical protein [Acidimicrobiales bacterium]
MGLHLVLVALVGMSRLLLAEKLYFLPGDIKERADATPWSLTE